MIRLLIGCLLLGSFASVQGQTSLTGVLSRAGTDNPIEAIMVQNRRTHQIVFSSRSGAFTIAAAENDTIIFSGVGYMRDSVIVTYALLITPYNLEMEINSIALQGVNVSSRYRIDSIARREDYERLVEQMRGITGGNTPQYGVGVVVSPSSFFSKKSKQKRIAKKRMESMEEEFYIDEKFNAGTVARLTRLQGDSLQLFLYMYRPTYRIARTLDRDGLIEYVSAKMKIFLRREEPVN